MSERDGQEMVTLRLVKTPYREIICDQEGRPLSDVVSFDYGVDEEDSNAFLTIRLRFPSPKWDGQLGLIVKARQVEDPV